jgi:AAA+ ATPase superfamily predicted ATPase
MSSNVVGRLEEQAELEDILNSGRSEFAAVVGRRRVGKTFLIRNYFKSKKCIYFEAIGLQNGSLEEQLKNFSDGMSETFYDRMPMQPPISWNEAFQRLTTVIEKQAKNSKIVLFFDELPWMATPRSGILEALDYVWNKYWVNFKNLKLIVCGSSSSWILKKIIYNKGGLHNRVTRQIIVHPFSLKETKLYLEARGYPVSLQAVLEIYMAIGGIPFYLERIKKQLSASQNINNLCFRKNGLLFDEFDKLFKSLFKEADAYIELVRLIAKRRYGISRVELEKKIKLSKKGGTLTERLKELEEAGFIISFLPLWHKTRGTYYKVIDEFSLFYLTWIEPEKNTLIKAEAKTNFWKLKHKTPAWNNWAGYAFEAVCYKHIDAIRQALNIPDGSRSAVWRAASGEQDMQSSGAQIDLLFDREDGAITLCEIKYSEIPFIIDKEYAKNLLNKKKVFVEKTKTNKQIFITLIAASGIKNNFYAEDLLSGVVTLPDFFG